VCSYIRILFSFPPTSFFPSPPIIPAICVFLGSLLFTVAIKQIVLVPFPESCWSVYICSLSVCSSSRFIPPDYSSQYSRSMTSISPLRLFFLPRSSISLFSSCYWAFDPPRFLNFPLLFLLFPRCLLLLSPFFSPPIWMRFVPRKKTKFPPFLLTSFKADLIDGQLPPFLPPPWDSLIYFMLSFFIILFFSPGFVFAVGWVPFFVCPDAPSTRWRPINQQAGMQWFYVSFFL